MTPEIQYKKMLRTIRSNFNVRLQSKTNYGRNEIFALIDAVLADSLADILEGNVDNKPSELFKPETVKAKSTEDDMPF